MLRLIPHHPAHADAAFTDLSRFEDRKPIDRLCLASVEHDPYPSVRGEAWQVLARYRRESRSMTASDKVKKFELTAQLIKELNLEDVADLKMA